MKTYEEYIEPEHKRSRLKSRTCDLCGLTAKTNEWGASSYEVCETEVEITIRQKEGSSYPEGGQGTEFEVDLCPKCFKEKLVPWLRSQGAKIEEREWDW